MLLFLFVCFVQQCLPQGQCNSTVALWFKWNPSRAESEYYWAWQSHQGLCWYSQQLKSHTETEPISSRPVQTQRSVWNSLAPLITFLEAFSNAGWVLNISSLHHITSIITKQVETVTLKRRWATVSLTASISLLYCLRIQALVSLWKARWWEKRSLLGKLYT